MANATAIDEDGRITLRFPDGEEVHASLAPHLDPVVVRTAIARNEPLVVASQGKSFVAMGALRTAATPGIDPGDDYVIAAKRLRLQGEHELSLVSGATQVVLRALGAVETLAENITTRAAGVHKLIGRVLHLN